MLSNETFVDALEVKSIFSVARVAMNTDSKISGVMKALTQQVVLSQDNPLRASQVFWPNRKDDENFLFFEAVLGSPLDDAFSDCVELGESGSPILFSQNEDLFVGGVFQSLEWRAKTSDSNEQPECDANLQALAVPMTEKFESWLHETVAYFKLF